MTIEQGAEPDGPDAFFWKALGDGRIVLPRCETCKRLHFYPRVVCPLCHSTALEWVEASGRAEVYTTTTVRRPADQGGDYNLAIIELEEGVRLMSRVEGVAPDTVRIGMRLTAYASTIDNHPAVLCRRSGDDDDAE